MDIRRIWAFIVSALITSLTVLHAEVKLPAIIGENMVIQNGRPVILWGWADAGEKVEVRGSWDNQTVSTQANSESRWQVKLVSPDLGGPYVIRIAGKNVIELDNIMCGEVWVCSGQSNMEFSVSAANNAQQEITAANWPKVRLFTVQKKIAMEPEVDCNGQWVECSPETVGDFSAVGYFFGRELHHDLGVPVGLIDSSWGGTPAESWTNAAHLRTIPEYAEQLDRIANIQRNLSAAMREYEAKKEEWRNNLLPKNTEWMKSGFGGTDWKTMILPQTWEKTEVGAFDGIVWFRKEVMIPSDWTGKSLELTLGGIDDMDSTYINGVRVGGLDGASHWLIPRKYIVPGENVKAGMAVR